MYINCNRRDIIFDHHYTSMVFFVFELINYVRETLWINLMDIINSSNGDNSQIVESCRPILAALNVKQSPMLPRIDRRLNTSAMDKLNTPIDLAPYGKNQCFRILGCGKNGKNRLRKWEPGSNTLVMEGLFRSYVTNPEDLSRSLVAGTMVQAKVECGVLRSYVLTPHHYPRRSARESSIVTNPEGLCDWPHDVSRWSRPDTDSSHREISVRESYQESSLFPPPCIDIAPGDFIDDTVEFMTENFGMIYFLNLRDKTDSFY